MLQHGTAVQDRQIARGERYPALGLHWLLGLVRLAQDDAGRSARGIRSRARARRTAPALRARVPCMPARARQRALAVGHGARTPRRVPRRAGALSRASARPASASRRRGRHRRSTGPRRPARRACGADKPMQAGIARERCARPQRDAARFRRGARCCSAGDRAARVRGVDDPGRSRCCDKSLKRRRLRPYWAGWRTAPGSHASAFLRVSSGHRRRPGAPIVLPRSHMTAHSLSRHAPTAGPAALSVDAVPRRLQRQPVQDRRLDGRRPCGDRRRRRARELSIVGAVFILPFLLFSGYAGPARRHLQQAHGARRHQVARDRRDRPRLRRVRDRPSRSSPTSCCS